MTIDGLNPLTTLTAGDELPVWDVEASAEEPTKKITASNLAASVKSLASLPNTTEMNAAIAQSTATLHRFNINSTSFSVFRVGNTVFCSCVAGLYDCPSSNGYLRLNGATGPLPQIPVGYRPAGSIDIKDNLANKRLTMTPASDSTTGRFTGNEAFTSQALRFNATWVTIDPMPT